MKNVIVIISVCFLILIALSGCSSSNEVVDREIRLYDIDTGFFKEYNYLWFPKNFLETDTSGFRVLTIKCNPQNIDFNKYEPLVIGETYDLKLFSVDSLISAELIRWKSVRDISGFVLEPNILFWDKGKIKVKVYFSNDLLGTYVCKGKKKKIK